MKTTETSSVLLIHGLWTTPSIWTSWLRFFQARGYDASAPTWPGVRDFRQRSRPDAALATLGVRDIVDHYARLLDRLDEPPVLIGHSLGGLVVQLLLDRGYGAAGVSVSGMVPKGIFQWPMSAIKAVRPILSDPRNVRRLAGFTFEQFRYALANTMDEAAARHVFESEIIAGPGRPIFETAFGNFIPNSPTALDHCRDERAPLLLVSASEDHLVPPAMNQANLRLYGNSTAVTDHQEFTGRSHLLIVEDGWADVAEFVQEWTQQNARRPVALPAGA